jgi:hypothetical protein
MNLKKKLGKLLGFLLLLALSVTLFTGCTQEDAELALDVLNAVLETEVEEDYFGVLWGEIIWALEDAGFDMVYASAFTLPYRKHQVQKRFSHVMNDITHKKIIYTKRGK